MVKRKSCEKYSPPAFSSTLEIEPETGSISFFSALYDIL
jgi:hypothetical protein